MPRTVWKQTDPRLQGNPQWENPSYLRGCAEEAHYEPQRKAFHIPLYIRPVDTTYPPSNTPSSTSTTTTEPQPTNSSTTTTIATEKTTTASAYRLDFRNHFNRHTSRLLSDLTPDDCRAFCWKDCVIYGSSPHLTGKDYMKLLVEVYNEWYPHRAEDKDISDGSFFGKLMRFITPSEARVGVGVGDIVHFHKLLCDKLKDLEGQIGLEVPVDPCAVRLNNNNGRNGPKLAEYKLRETFDRVFIVLDDAAWQQRGVLLVWASKRDAERHNCSVLSDDDDGGNDNEHDDAHNDDGDGQEVRTRLKYGHDRSGDATLLGSEVCMFRCPLKRAMQIVVSRDPERAARRREYNEMLEEMLGEE